ncbi:XdhC family protein [Thermoflexus sp.]|uniref:XdhC family protein n=1 Tax=Thermoflexus sp. TaxID=1969742 RepID=UPI0017733F42|nr:XdhC family protein [Thermoflexus sp.]
MGWRLSGGIRLDELIRDLEARGEAFVIATVVRRQPPVSARVGDRAVITADGQIYGWVGGGCAHDLILREARAVLASRRPRLLRITPEAVGEGLEEEARSVATMACPSRGELEIFLEPWVREPQLLIFGESPLARTLALFGHALGYEVTQVIRGGASREAPEGIRIAYLGAIPAFSSRDELYVVVASMGHYDEEALAAALRTPACYIGLVASRRRAQAVLDLLRQSGWSEADLGRIRAPAGLDLGAVTQEEIALSVMAEIMQERRRTMAEQMVSLESTSPQARDPVCGMEVEVATARYHAEWEGQRFYFCCAHCRQAFLTDPARYTPAVAQPERGQ